MKWNCLIRLAGKRLPAVLLIGGLVVGSVANGAQLTESDVLAALAGKEIRPVLGGKPEENRGQGKPGKPGTTKTGDRPRRKPGTDHVFFNRGRYGVEWDSGDSILIIDKDSLVLINIRAWQE